MWYEQRRKRVPYAWPQPFAVTFDVSKILTLHCLVQTLFIFVFIMLMGDFSTITFMQVRLRLPGYIRRRFSPIPPATFLLRERCSAPSAYHYTGECESWMSMEFALLCLSCTNTVIFFCQGAMYTWFHSDWGIHGQGFYMNWFAAPGEGVPPNPTNVPTISPGKENFTIDGRCKEALWLR